MAIIKKNDFKAETIVFPNKQGKIKYWVDVQPEQIEIKVYSNESIGEEETADIVILWDIIKISELQKKAGFVDQSLWTRIHTSILPVQEDSELPYTYSPLVLHESALIDMFGKTLVEKPNTLMTVDSNYRTPLYSIFAADTNDFTKCTIRLMFDAKYEPGFEVQGPSANLFVDEHIDIKDLVTPITLSSTQSVVTQDSSIVVTVNSEPFIDEVFLESVSGILNKIRVKLTNGQGSFSILTTGLEIGDEVRVKAGHRKWTGIASFSKQIS